MHQVGKAELDEPDSRDEEQLDRLLDRLRTETDRSPGRWAAAVPDEDVDASEGLDRALDDGVEITRIGDVAANRECAETFSFAHQHLAATREHRHVRSLPRERFCRRETEPGGGAADDRGSVFETEVH